MRVSYEEYLAAIAMTLTRRHRPAWSRRAGRRFCSCGSELPCRTTHRIPISRQQWPDQEDQ